MLIEWKLFWTAAATIIAASLVVLSATGIMAPWLAVLLAVILGAAAAAASRAIIDVVEMWRGVGERHLNHIWAGIIGTAAAYTAWTATITIIIATAGATTQHIITAASTMAVIALLTYWTARGLEWRIHQALKHPEDQQAEADSSDEADQYKLLDHREKALQEALRLARFPWVRVMPGAIELRDKAGHQFRASIQQSRATSNNRYTLTQKDAEPIAIALARLTGRDIESSWVRIRKERVAGIYSITVTNRNIMAEVIPYVDDPAPTSIKTPAWVGVEVDGRRHHQRLNSHQRDIGASTSGKSSLINVKLAHLTRSPDTLVWIGGVQKLYDLVGPWIEPYEDTGLRPPIDWVAHGQIDTMTMMASAMNVARWRQSQLMTSRQWRDIVVILDEFSFVAQSKQRIMWSGESVTASLLASAMLRGSASGNVYVHFATQRSTTDHFGDHGGDVISNIAVNNAFRSRDFAELGRMTGDYQLPMPTEKGEFYEFSDAEPVNLKAPYIQTTDPSKPRLHDGATVAEVSWARRHLTTGGLTEAEGAAAAGAAYAARYQTVDAEFLSYLTGAGTEPATTSAAGAVPMMSDVDITAAVHAQLDALPVQAESGPEAETREDRITAILEDADETGLTAADITDRLDDGSTVDVVSATLSRMVRTGTAGRPARGRYTAPNQTNEQPNTNQTAT